MADTSDPNPPKATAIAPWLRNSLLILSYVGKAASFVAGGVAIAAALPPQYAAGAVFVFAAASLLKDTVKGAGDILDDGQRNNSFNVD